jgi:DUF2971 family protein
MGTEQPTVPEWMLDPVIYHYTTLDALLSIVQHSALWATHIRYMNDTSEQNVLWDRLRKAAESRLENEHGPNREWLSEVLQATEDPEQTEVFAVCFSKDGGNRLSQWRGYSQDRGVSIGFNIGSLQRCCNAFTARWYLSAPERAHGGAMLLPVIYVGPETEAHLERVIEGYLGGQSYIGDNRRQSLSKGVSFFAANTKHPAFVEEKEWRIMLFDHVAPQPMKFRTRGSMVVPYRELDFQPSIVPAIHNIIVGPSPHQRENRESIKKLTGLSDEQILLSDTPYRDW